MQAGGLPDGKSVLLRCTGTMSDPAFARISVAFCHVHKVQTYRQAIILTLKRLSIGQDAASVYRRRHHHRQCLVSRKVVSALQARSHAV